jgi:hypothetical protein
MERKEYQREHNIQSDIRLWCGENGILCFRCNVGRVRMADGGWFDTGLPNGFSDLIVLHNKTIYFVEVKTKTGRQRQDQIDFMNLVRKYGYVYIVARSVNDVKEGLGWNGL